MKSTRPKNETSNINKYRDLYKRYKPYFEGFYNNADTHNMHFSQQADEILDVYAHLARKLEKSLSDYEMQMPENMVVLLDKDLAPLQRLDVQLDTLCVHASRYYWHLLSLLTIAGHLFDASEDMDLREDISSYSHSLEMHGRNIQEQLGILQELKSELEDMQASLIMIKQGYLTKQRPLLFNSDDLLNPTMAYLDYSGINLSTYSDNKQTILLELTNDYLSKYLSHDEFQRALREVLGRPFLSVPLRPEMAIDFFKRDLEKYRNVLFYVGIPEKVIRQLPEDILMHVPDYLQHQELARSLLESAINYYLKTNEMEVLTLNWIETCDVINKTIELLLMHCRLSMHEIETMRDDNWDNLISLILGNLTPPEICQLEAAIQQQFDREEFKLIVTPEQIQALVLLAIGTDPEALSTRLPEKQRRRWSLPSSAKKNQSTYSTYTKSPPISSQTQNLTRVSTDAWAITAVNSDLSSFSSKKETKANSKREKQKTGQLKCIKRLTF